MTVRLDGAEVWPVRLLATTNGWLSRVPLSALQLLMRLAIGSVFFNAGVLKCRSWEVTLLLFRDEYKVPLIDPALLARIATFNELACSTLLVLGLATRVATLPFLGMIVVIQIFVYPNAWIEHLTWASILLALLTRGGGTLSVDHLIARRYEASRWPQPGGSVTSAPSRSL
jgi:putative oxidoreductase